MVDPIFNDTTGEFFKAFEQMLQCLDAKNSEKKLCIEEYLIESEKTWFKRFRQAKLNRSRGPSPMGSPNPSVSSLSNYRPYRSYQSSPARSERNSSDNESTMDTTSLTDDEFLLGRDYQRPSAPKRLMQRRIGDWPIYSLILALGQILAANSYQITLLTGGQGQTPEKLYIIGGIYMAMTCVWWAFYRNFKSLYVLSVPFAIYGLAFVFVGMAPFLGPGSGRDTMRNVATGLYAAASASGSLFFSLNFGDDGKITFSILTLPAYCVLTL
jgi:alpha-1,3-glucan synthase